LMAAGPDGQVRLRGDVLISDINELFHLDLPHTEVYTIGGLAMAMLGRSPQLGDELIVAGTRLRVEAVNGPAVREVSLYPPQHESDAGLQLPGEYGGNDE
jgi:CBS domain containing-hemolysin-like protein